MDLSSIGRNICKYRLKRKMSQEELAEKAGFSPNYMGAMERGEKRPSLTALIRIANALEISTDLLLVDVVSVGYAVKESLLSEKLAEIAPEDRKEIYEVIDVMLKYTKPAKPRRK